MAGEDRGEALDARGVEAGAGGVLRTRGDDEGLDAAREGAAGRMNEALGTRTPPAPVEQ